MVPWRSSFFFLTRPAQAPLSPAGVGSLVSGSYEFGGLSCSRSSGSGEPGRARQLGRPASEESEETGGHQQSVSSCISGTDFVPRWQCAKIMTRERDSTRKHRLHTHNAYVTFFTIKGKRASCQAIIISLATFIARSGQGLRRLFLTIFMQ